MATINQVKLRIKQFLWGSIVKALSGQGIHFVRKHQDFLVCVVPNGHAFWIRYNKLRKFKRGQKETWFADFW
jgi:hypothetical protein